MRITNSTTTNRRKRKAGVAAIVMLALLALVLAFIFANLRTLSDLRGELKIIEQKQIHRLNHPATNAPAGSATVPATSSPAGAVAKSLPE
jgi:hypothetical protein